jgi:hypothetical protein
MLKTLTIISLLIIAAVALAFTLAPTSPAALEFFPLAKNNRWKHLVVFSGGDYIYYMTETVVDDGLQLSDGKSFVVSEEYEPLTTTAPEAKSTVAYFRKDGFLHRYPWLDSNGAKVWDTKLGEGAEQILPSPYVGELTWPVMLKADVWPLSGRQHSSSVASARIDPEEVWVAGGVFRNCLRIETITANQLPDPKTKKLTTFDLHHVEWYAPGVGLVRAISSEGEGTPIKSVTELVEYTVQP